MNTGRWKDDTDSTAKTWIKSKLLIDHCVSD